MSQRSVGSILLTRLAPVALLALMAACGGSSVTGAAASSHTVASVQVSPAVDTAVSLGLRITFTAVARNASGAKIAGMTFTWSSSDSGVAIVYSDGEVAPQSDGKTTIIAAAEGKADTAILVVAQKTVRVSVGPDSVRLPLADDTVRFEAKALDAGSHEVTSARITWSVSDSGVAVVDSLGLVTARSAGRITVRATAGTAAGTSVLRVSDGPPPQIDSVSPSPIVGGTTATFTGQGFDPSTVGDTVVVDGSPAAVTAATTTSLQVAVPRYDCRPERTVLVRLATDGGVAQATSSFKPAGGVLSISTGKQVLITDPANFCLQFGGGSARYLVGIQALAATSSALTDVTVASIPGATPSASVASAVIAARPRRQTGGARSVETPAWLRGQQRADASLRSWERTHLNPTGGVPALRRSVSSSVSPTSATASVSTGDLMHLRVPTANSSDPCTHYVDVTGRVQVVGTRAIVVADTANPTDGFTSGDYASFSSQLDSQIFGTDVDYFGDPGDIDGNGHILILFSKAVNRLSADSSKSYPLGFVFAGDWYPRASSSTSSCASSDQGEIYYGRVPDPNGIYGAASTRKDELARAPLVMAHELVHLIQFGRRIPLGLPFMGPALAEAQATFGEEVVGFAETGGGPNRNYYSDVVFSATKPDSVYWFLNKFTDLVEYFGFKSATSRVDGAPEQCGWWREDPSPCLSRPLWYGVGWSFLRWLTDQYVNMRGGNAQTLQRDIVVDPRTGLDAASDVIGTPMDSLMAQWAAALYTDDRVPYLDRHLIFWSWNLDSFQSAIVPTARLQPTAMSNPYGTLSTQVRASSAAYLIVGGDGWPPNAVRIRAASGNPLPAYMQVWVVRL